MDRNQFIGLILMLVLITVYFQFFAPDPIEEVPVVDNVPVLQFATTFPTAQLQPILQFATVAETVEMMQLSSLQPSWQCLANVLHKCWHSC